LHQPRSAQLGSARPDIAPARHDLPARRYLILYREITEGVEIVRVMPGTRDLKVLMSNR
jgi:toxin ParE1/3/4